MGRSTGDGEAPDAAVRSIVCCRTWKILQMKRVDQVEAEAPAEPAACSTHAQRRHARGAPAALVVQPLEFWIPHWLVVSLPQGGGLSPSLSLSLSPPGLILSPLLPPRLSSSVVLSSPAFCWVVLGLPRSETGAIEGDDNGVPAGVAQGEGGARGEPGHLRPPHPQQRPLRHPPPRSAGNKRTLCSGAPHSTKVYPSVPKYKRF